MVIMKQMDDCLTRFFTNQRPLKKKWFAGRADEETFVLYHYHHLVMIYNFKYDQILYEWWERDADKRGLDSAKEWLHIHKGLTKQLLES